ncbi:MAG: hypothetical protein JXX14_15805, partial [Deltaproteobacteria bacterium]|nr:hypothetical protein [Deltaproteobacteria bacterium]
AVALTPTIHRGIGTLFARNPRTDKTAQNAMRMNAHLVNVAIQEGVAITEVEERFTNTSNVTVEATYRFLVPKEAEITRLALDVNGRIEEGEVLEKQRAAKIFKQIVDDAVRPKDPALLEWERGAEFRMKIFPIKPGETRRVFLTYTTPMTYHDGYYRYEYPIANPGGTVPVDTFSIKANVSMPLAIRNLRTPLFESNIGHKNNHATLAYDTRGATPENDFVISFETDPFPGGLRSLVQTEKNGQSFGMFMWHPDQDKTQAPVNSPRRVVAMVDVSYGVSTEMIELAAATLVELMGGLGHRDRFNVLACDDSCHPLFPDFMEPGAAAMMQMYRHIVAITPGGASNMSGNFQQAFTAVGNAPNSAVVYIGDGIATSGELESSRLVALLTATKPENVRVHTIGVGPAVDSKILARMAADLNGMNFNLSFGDSPASASWQLSRMFTADALTNVQASLRDTNGRSYQLFPARVGFLPAGQSLQLVTNAGSLPQGIATDATLHITAQRLDGQQVDKTFNVSLQPGVPAPGFVSRLWAAKYIDALSFAGDRDQEIIDVSSQYRIASRLTSWIVLENQRMYDIFNVARTDSEQMDMTPAQFTETEEEMPADAEGNAAEEKVAEAPAMRARGMMADEHSAVASGRAPQSKSSAAPKRRTAERAKSDLLSNAMDGPSANMIARDDDRMKKVSGGGTRSYQPPRCSGPRYNVEISRYTGDGPNAQSKKNRILTDLSANMLSRTLHRQYVRQLAKMTNRRDAQEAANQWRQQDAYSTAAVRAYAAEVARSGNRREAARLYSGISELLPNDINFHRRLAQTFRDLGDFAAAAGHYGALWSIIVNRPRSGQVSKDAANDWMDYLFALAMSGQHQLFNEEVLSPRNQTAAMKVSTELAALRQGVQTGILPEWSRHAGKGGLKVELNQTADDLDIMLIDPFGRVSGGLWRFGAEVQGLTTKGAETLWSSNLLEGTYQIVVARTDEKTDVITRGAVTIQLKGKTQKIPFEFNGPSAAVAKVIYDRLPDKHCYRY